jgi:hypothetical protein
VSQSGTPANSYVIHVLMLHNVVHLIGAWLLAERQHHHSNSRVWLPMWHLDAAKCHPRWFVHCVLLASDGSFYVCSLPSPGGGWQPLTFAEPRRLLGVETAALTC